jgi:hypothetical protein
MDSPNKRPVDELVTRYKYHPELRDLFVEGDRDVAFFRWFFDHLPGSKATVYHINAIDIPSDAVDATGLAREGNKGRVLALALMLDQLLPTECRSVYGCVDRDFHGLGFDLPKCRFLIYTDHACMECYALNVNPITKLFNVYLGKTLSDSELDSMIAVLRQVFFVRLAKRMMAPAATWFEEFTKCCSIKGSRVVLNESKFLSRVLNVAAGALTRNAVEAEVKRLGSLQTPKGYHAVHGHDLVQLISWIAQKKGVDQGIRHPTPLSRAIFGLIEFADIRKEPLFMKVAGWASQSDAQGPAPLTPTRHSS